MPLIRIPKRFFRDHSERDLPTPRVVCSTGQHFWIDAGDPHLPELRDDATFYAGADGPDLADAPGLRAAAQGLLRALDAPRSRQP